MGIRIKDLSVAYGTQLVIDGLQLTVAPGAFFTLLGPSGCGKTTLLRTVAGFIPAVRGSVWFGDREVTALQAHERDIGMVFQDYALFPNRTVFENVAYGLRARNTEAAAITKRVKAALERVGLEAYGERHPAALSGGQRQRVALARALVIQPRVLLMDEPLSNLDAKLRIQVRQTIAELQREAGITTVFVTHDQDEALALSDSIAVMNKGRIEQLGSPSEIYQSPVSSYVADFVGAANVVPLATSAVTVHGEQAHVALAGVQVAAKARAPLTNAQCFLVVRPEDIGIALSGGVPARVQSQQYLGVKTSYRLQLEGGLSLNVDQHGSHRAVYANGSLVSLVFDANKTLVLAA